MPKISEFFGIAIYIYYRDHAPPPLPCDLRRWRSSGRDRSLAILRGRLSPRALGLVTEWASMHQEELMRVWNQARQHEPLDPIAPLQ